MARNANEMSEKERDLLSKILVQLGLDDRSEESATPTRRWVASDEMRDALLYALLQRDLAVARVAAAEAWSGGTELRRFDDIVRAGTGLRDAVQAYLEDVPELRDALKVVDEALATLHAAVTLEEARTAMDATDEAIRRVHGLRQRAQDRGRALLETKFQTRLLTGGTPYVAGQAGAAEGRGLRGYDPERGPLIRRTRDATAAAPPPPARPKPTQRGIAPAGQRALFTGGGLED